MRTILALALLTLASAFVIVLGASQEPYLEFRPIDAIIQVGAGSALLIVWIQVLAVTLWRISERRLQRSWVATVAWGLIASYHLALSPVGYVSDLAKFGVCG